MSWVASGGGGKKRASLNFIKDRAWEKNSRMEGEIGISSE